MLISQACFTFCFQTLILKQFRALLKKFLQLSHLKGPLTLMLIQHIDYSRAPNRPHGGKEITRLENDIDIGCRATEMCPNKKAIDFWLSALENL